MLKFEILQGDKMSRGPQAGTGDGVIEAYEPNFYPITRESSAHTGPVLRLTKTQGDKTEVIEAQVVITSNGNNTRFSLRECKPVDPETIVLKQEKAEEKKAEAAPATKPEVNTVPMSPTLPPAQKSVGSL